MRLSNIQQILETVRELNVQALAHAVVEHAPCHVEPAFRTEDGELAIEGDFDLPCRADIIPIDDEGGLLDSIMVDPTSKLQFDSIELQLKGAAVSISSFGWDYADFIAAFSMEPDYAPLIQWFMKWFDANEQNTEGADGLFEVLHFMSDPEYADGRVNFTVDFGSAPIEALQSLIETLLKMGATRVEVS